MSEPTRPKRGVSPYSQLAPEGGEEKQQPPPPPRYKRIFHFLSGLIALILGIVPLVYLTLWLVLKPRYPQLQVDSFAVTSPFNLTPNGLSTSWDVELNAINPNGKVNVDYYNEIKVEVFYKGNSLAETSFEGFGQGTKEERVLKASLAASNASVDAGDVDAMNEEMKNSNGNVEFRVWVNAPARFKAGLWVKKRRVKFLCENLVVSVAGNGSKVNGLNGGPVKCSIIGKRSFLK